MVGWYGEQYNEAISGYVNRIVITSDTLPLAREAARLDEPRPGPLGSFDATSK